MVFAFLLVGVVSTALAGILVDRTVRRLSSDQVEERLRYEVTMTGQMMASALFAPLAPDDTSLRGPVTDLARAVKTQLSVLTPEGVVAADSDRAVDAAPVLEGWRRKSLRRASRARAAPFAAQATLLGCGSPNPWSAKGKFSVSPERRCP